MPRYLISFDDGSMDHIPEADMPAVSEAARAVVREARAAGARAFEAWATPFSKPLFERAGFTLERVVSEPYQGVMFERYRMVTRMSTAIATAAD